MTDAHAEERTLVLLRHSKAEPPDEDGPDVNRPLSARGRADAAAAGAWLARHGLLPDVVICSAARRTRQTWHQVAMGMTGTPPEGGPAGPAPAVHYEADAYEAQPEDLLALVRRVDPAARTVLLVAHNPGVSLFSALLDPVRAEQDGLRTSDLVVHRTGAPWAELGRGSAAIADRHTARG
ncbi:SixA phosphatase family protein [Micromonospora sp. LZ34]